MPVWVDLPEACAEGCDGTGEMVSMVEMEGGVGGRDVHDDDPVNYVACP